MARTEKSVSWTRLVIEQHPLVFHLNEALFSENSGKASSRKVRKSSKIKKSTHFLNAIDEVAIFLDRK